MAYPRTKKLKLEKYVVGVPDKYGRLTQCVVLWESRFWKSVILIGITDLTVEPDQNTVDVGKFVSVIYTSATLIRSGHWKLQGSIPIEIPEELKTYKAGGTKYCGDERVGPVGTEDLPLTMNCAGMGYVEAYIDFLLHGGEAKKGLVKQHEAVKGLVNAKLNSAI